MKQRIGLAALAAALISSGAAHGADILGRAEGSVKDYTPTRSWTGFYIGIEAGGGAGVFEAARRSQRSIDIQDSSFTKPDGDDFGTDPDPICCGQAYNDDGTLKNGVTRTTEITRLLNDAREDKLDLGLDGFFGGVNVEYKRQIGSNFVAGIFGNFDWGKMSGSDTYARQVSLSGEAIDAFKGTNGSADYALATETGSVSIERKWNGDAGLKLGYLFTPDTLVYGLVAASFGRFNVKGGSDISVLDGADRFSPYPGSSFDESETKVGLKLGGGIESRLRDNMTMGLEGSWTRYRNLGAGFGGSQYYADEDCPDDGIITSTREVIDGKLGIWDVKATLKYQLN
jgi:opacity protein-like surface antigen